MERDADHEKLIISTCSRHGQFLGLYCDECTIWTWPITVDKRVPQGEIYVIFDPGQCEHVAFVHSSEDVKQIKRRGYSRKMSVRH